MKKSQRLRFFALVNKQSQGTVLTTAEATELTTLSTLVATHPNAADDTDDEKEETDEEKKKREKKEADAQKAEDDKKKEDEEKKKDADAKASAAKPGPGARLAAALAGLKGGTPAQAAADLKAEKAAHAKTTGDLTQARTDLAATKATLKNAETALSALCDFLGLKPADIAGKAQADIDGICTAKINAAAIEQVASIGFPAASLPAPSGEGKPSTKAELLAAYNALTDSGERAAFYAKHKDVLFA